MFYNYIIFNYYLINEVILLSETNVLYLSSFSFNLVWVAYLFSSTNYLGVPNSAQWTYNWKFLFLHNFSILYLKAQICINYYSVWV